MTGSLFTWRDVRDRLAGATAPAWQTYEISPVEVLFWGPQAKIFAQLHELFGVRWDAAQAQLRLLSVPPEERKLRVVVEQGDTSAARSPIPRPLWQSTPAVSPPREPNFPEIAAFFSFKGGVGRTTLAWATTVALLSRKSPPKVLFVDADTEAPGITWLLPERPERLSWLDALALVHDAEDWRREAMPLIADQVRVQQVALDLPDGRRELFVLPAIRTPQQMLKLPATPEQLVRARERTWVIGDFLGALGQMLGAEVVIVDLRAGMSEFASPILLDQRIQNVLVTSCARQSIKGSIFAFETLGARRNWTPPPDIVINQVPPQSGPLAEQAKTDILDAWVATSAPESADDNAPNLFTAAFAQELLAFDDLASMAARLRGTELWDIAGQLADKWAPEKTKLLPNALPKEPKSLLKKISQLAQHYEFAESGDQQRLLPIPPLRSLARTSGHRLAAAVVLGAKGSGKTFTWMQMVLAGRWEQFCQTVGEPTAAVADIFPLLTPEHLKEGALAMVTQAEKGGPGQSRLTATQLRRQITDPRPIDDGLQFWLTTIVDRLGLEPSAAASLATVEAAIATRKRPLVLVIDGLEDAVQSSTPSPDQKKILLGLLSDLMAQLRELASPYLGLIVFVRRDIALSAIPQNFGQFENNHRAYTLSWSVSDALRLTLWILNEAGWSLLPPDEILTAGQKQLEEALYAFWGQQMGGPKQAYTANWVIAALSDLNGRFQARDLVRLIHHATQKSTGLPLSPKSLVDAVAECSRAKVKELEQEVGELRAPFDKLRNLAPHLRTVPCDRDALGLNDQELMLLDVHGILFFDKRDQKYYMPEIIREGLDFTLSRRGRARVVRLLNDARRRNPSG